MQTIRGLLCAHQIYGLSLKMATDTADVQLGIHCNVWYNYTLASAHLEKITERCSPTLALIGCFSAGTLTTTDYTQAVDMAPGKQAQPTLPKKKAASGTGKKAAAAGGKELPIAFAQFITLEDGTQVSCPALAVATPLS